MKYTESEIKSSLQRVSAFITRNHRNPTTITVGEDKLTLEEYLKLEPIANAKKNIQAFTKKNNRCPNYVIICQYEITKNVYTTLYTLQCTSTTNNTTTNNDKWLNPPQCGQDTPYYCACASLQQSFYHLTGKTIAESTLAKVCGTTSAGTGHDGINTAVAWFNKTYNTNLKIKWYNFTDLGSWDKIKELMDKSNVAIFFHLKYANGGQCKNACQFGHYESARKIDLKANTITVNNSLGDKSGSKYKGMVQTRSLSCQKKMMSYISQPSIAIITK